MLVSRKELLTLYCLTILTRLSPVISFRQMSVKFKMVQPASVSPLNGNRIRCAANATHHSYAAIRLAKGSGICERLTDVEMDLGMEAGFEYFRKYSATLQLQPSLAACTESERRVTFYTYTKVKVGDLFEFVVQKCGNNRFIIEFRSHDDRMLFIMSSRTSGYVVFDTYTTGGWGVEERYPPPGPFASYKEYRIRFEIFDAYWEISTDQKVWYQFYGHRLPVSTIRKVKAISYGPHVNIRSINITTAVP